MKRYVCDVCGYVYDPQEGEIDLCITGQRIFPVGE